MENIQQKNKAEQFFNTAYSSSNPNTKKEYFKLALKIFKKIGNENLYVTKCYYNLGCASKDNNKRKKYFNKAIPLAKKIKDFNILALCYNNLGTRETDSTNRKKYFEAAFDLFYQKRNYLNAARTKSNLAHFEENKENKINYLIQAIETAKEGLNTSHLDINFNIVIPIKLNQMLEETIKECLEQLKELNASYNVEYKTYTIEL